MPQSGRNWAKNLKQNYCVFSSPSNCTFLTHAEPPKVEGERIPDLPILTCCKLDQFSQIFLHTRTDGMIFYHKMTFPLLYCKKNKNPTPNDSIFFTDLWPVII